MQSVWGYPQGSRRTLMTVWRHINVPEAGYAHAMSVAIQRAGRVCPNLLWPVNDGIQLLLSDYSGQHRGATHEVYSFLIATWDTVQDWLPLRDEFRARWLPDGRRISFKQLREPMRRRAYPHFLELVGLLQANLITFMIDCRVRTFVDGGPEALAAELNDCFLPGTSGSTIEKIYRIALFVAMIQAGLRDEAQQSYWISDQDEILDSFQKGEGFARLATYLSFGLTGWRNAAEQGFLTTAALDTPDWVEDMAAIPDIAAGACARLSSHLPTFLGRPTWTIGRSSAGVADWRALAFANWLSEPRGIIRHVLVRLEPNADGEIQASAQSFQRPTK